MNLIWQYTRRFWYVATNWNIWMACFMVYDNIRGSLKYGRNTFIPADLHQLTIVNGDLSTSSRYEAVSYYMLEKLLAAFCKISPERSITDLGCGKGRVMMAAAHFGFTTVTGIDFATELCTQAVVNMKATEAKYPGLKWRVLNEPVTEYSIGSNDSVFFMFHPFEEVILREFLSRVHASCIQFPRTIYFLYANPECLQLLLDNGYAVIYQKKMMYLQGIIAVADKLEDDSHHERAG